MTAPRPMSETQLRLAKPLIKFFSHFHGFLYKASGGKLAGKVGGGDICIVTMKGAKTGKPRDFPLMHIPYKDGIVLVASLGGAPRHPVWYYNLVANPEIEVLWNGQRNRYRARQASSGEKEEIWPVCDSVYPDFALYRRRTERDIPVFVCEPVVG